MKKELLEAVFPTVKQSMISIIFTNILRKEIPKKYIGYSPIPLMIWIVV
jgi:hypothetical protein